MACLTRYIAGGENSEPTEAALWLDWPDYMDASSTTQYAVNLYWLTSISLGERAFPQNEAHLVFTLIATWAGTISQMMIFGTIMQLIGNLDIIAKSHKEKVEYVNHYMRKLHVPRDLQDRVQDYFDFQFDRNKGIDSRAVLEHLPKHLRDPVALHVNQKLIEGVSIFEGTSTAFLTALLVEFRMAVCIAGDVICREGQAADEMFYIYSGELEERKFDRFTGKGTRYISIDSLWTFYPLKAIQYGHLTKG